MTYAIPDATHDPRKDTYALAALRARDGLPLWRVPTTRHTALIAAADGVLIMSDSATNHLIGLRASDGATLWRATLYVGLGQADGSPAVASSVASSGGVLYVMGNSDNGPVSALRFADGHILWQTHIRRRPYGLPVVDDTNVYIAVGDGSVLALQANTGAVRWTVFTDSMASQDVFHYPLGSFSGELYVSASDTAGVNPTVLRLNAADGANGGVALRLPRYTEALYPALTADIFTTVIYPSVPPGATSAPAPTLTSYRLSATSDGQLLWSVREQYGGEFLPTAHDAQTFYVEFQPGMISAYHLSDGVVRWRRQALALDTPIVADAGGLVETMPGIDDVCRSPLTHQAPQVRALAAASGAVDWTRALDATT